MPPRQFVEVIMGYGHPNVFGDAPFHRRIHQGHAPNKKRRLHLSRSHRQSLADLNPQFKANLHTPNAKLTVKIEAGDLEEEIHAYGSPQLALSDPVEMVLRKSDFASERTLGIRADKAAKDISRELVERLKNPNQQVKITLAVTV
jgi:hypothetical protein